MVKNVRVLIQVLIIAMIVLLIPNKAFSVEARMITLDKTSITIDEGSTYQLNARITPRRARDTSIKWTSQHDNIASVDSSGLVKGEGDGITLITATTENGRVASCIVRVNSANRPVTDIKLNKTEMTLIRGEKSRLIANITPSNANDKTITWESSNFDIVSVYGGYICGKNVGTATIKATASNGQSVSCEITVKEKEAEVNKVILNKSAVQLKRGDEFTLTATVIPDTVKDKTITWTSSNTSVAEIKDGKITAKGVGTSIITATSVNNRKALCIVRVLPIYVESLSFDKNNAVMVPGDNMQLNVTFTPADSTNKSVTYISTDESIATVSNTGLVKAIKPGKVTIIARSYNYKEARCEVRVHIPAKKVTLNKTELTLDIGKSEKLVATLDPANSTSTIEWSSSNPSVAEVKNGVVTAKKAGSANITVKTSNDKTATCKVKVKEKEVEVSAIKLNKTSLTLKKGASEKLTASVTPSNATNKKLTWKSSNTSIVEVNNGTVKAKKNGTATITVSTSNGKKATCKVTVTDKTIAVTKITLNKTSVKLNKGATAQLKATVSPSDATNKTITWSSSNTSVATVKNGKITAIKDGTATITAKSNNGKTATCKVTVSGNAKAVTKVTLNKTSLTLNKGGSAQLTAKITPSDASNKTITWSSSNNSIATVKNGKVTALKAGTVTITAKSNNGKTAKCKVTVKNAAAVNPTGITMVQKDVTIAVGKTKQLNANVTPANATNKTIKWTTSDKKIATVSNKGLVKGIKPGKVTITATTSNNKKVTCIVRVNIPARSIRFSDPTITISKGEVGYLLIIFNPMNTTSKEIKFESANKSIATVNSKGYVTGVNIGTTTIKATSKYGKTATCKVIVSDKLLYVSPWGKDSNNGKTEKKAFRTIKHGISKLSAGYTLIVCGGKEYKENNLTLSKKGTKTNPIKIEFRDAEINGNGKKTILTIKDSQYISISGWSIFKNLNANDAKGIIIKGGVNNIVLDGIHFENIKTKNPKGENDGASAIFLDGSSKTPINNITIKNCSLENISAGYSEAISVDGNCTNITIDRVNVTYTGGLKGNIGICVCGNYGTCSDKSKDRPRNVTISNCNVSNCKSPYDPGSAYGIYVDGGENVKIFNNTVSNCEGGIEIGAEQKNSKIHGRETENIQVYNNTIKNCGVGTQIGGWDGKATVYNVTLTNNKYTNCGHNGGRTIEFSKCNKVTITKCTFSTKESKTYENSSMAKNITKKNNTYGK